MKMVYRFIIFIQGMLISWFLGIAWCASKYDMKPRIKENPSIRKKRTDDEDDEKKPFKMGFQYDNIEG